MLSKFETSARRNNTPGRAKQVSSMSNKLPVAQKIIRANSDKAIHDFKSPRHVQSGYFAKTILCNMVAAFLVVDISLFFNNHIAGFGDVDFSLVACTDKVWRFLVIFRHFSE